MAYIVDDIVDNYLVKPLIRSLDLNVPFGQSKQQMAINALNGGRLLQNSFNGRGGAKDVMRELQKPYLFKPVDFMEESQRVLGGRGIEQAIQQYHSYAGSPNGYYPGNSRTGQSFGRRNKPGSSYRNYNSHKKYNSYNGQKRLSRSGSPYRYGGGR
jgi:hypothetical protein